MGLTMVCSSIAIASKYTSCHNGLSQKRSPLMRNMSNWRRRKADGPFKWRIAQKSRSAKVSIIVLIATTGIQGCKRLRGTL